MRFEGMSTRERLHAAGLLYEFEEAAVRHDERKMSEMLQATDVSPSVATRITKGVLASRKADAERRRLDAMSSLELAAEFSRSFGYSAEPGIGVANLKELLLTECRLNPQWGMSSAAAIDPPQSLNPYEPPQEDCSTPDPEVFEAHVLFERDLVDPDRTLPGPIVWMFWLCGGATLGIFSGACVQWIDEELMNVPVALGLLSGLVGGGMHVLARGYLRRSAPGSQ